MIRRNKGVCLKEGAERAATLILAKAGGGTWGTIDKREIDIERGKATKSVNE